MGQFARDFGSGATIPNWILAWVAVNLVFLSWAEFLNWWEAPGWISPTLTGYGLFHTLMYALQTGSRSWAGEGLGIGPIVSALLYGWILLRWVKAKELGKAVANRTRPWIEPWI